MDDWVWVNVSLVARNLFAPFNQETPPLSGDQTDDEEQSENEADDFLRDFVEYEDDDHDEEEEYDDGEQEVAEIQHEVYLRVLWSLASWNSMTIEHNNQTFSIDAFDPLGTFTETEH
eukprot:GABV01011659.1.p1 GENE.GABV01011659.1~~GABV01011659.1.p1  ORF type:complete len:117 (-),score=37.32 GABV01011659.1:11-361(-)